MSYDITLMPRRPGQSWDEALEESNDTQIADRTGLLRTWERIEERLGGVLDGQVEVYRSAPDSPELTVGELSALDTGIQVQLFPGQAAVSFAYWEQADPEDFHRQVREAVRVVVEETGYAAYDPQTGEGFDGSFDDETGLTFTRQLQQDGGGASGAALPVDPAGTHGQPSAELDAYLQRASTEQPRRRFSGRRRAGTYLAVGAVVTIFAVWSLTSGNGGALSWVALVIGVVDLLVGVVSWRSSTSDSVTTPPPGT